MIYPNPGAPRPHTPAWIAGPGSAFYDDAGNLTQLGTRTYTYDERGKLIEATDGAGELRKFGYELEGRMNRIFTTGNSVNRYLMTPDFEWDKTGRVGKIHLRLGGARIATLEDHYFRKRGGCGQITPGTNLGVMLPVFLVWLFFAGLYERRRQMFAAMVAISLVAAGGYTSQAMATAPLAETYYHTDYLKSSVYTSNEIGTLRRKTYQTYGQIVPGADPESDQVPEFGFTAQRFVEAVGIYNYGARWYDPAYGQFLQPDSIVPSLSDPQNLNRYAYVLNNPVNFVDPDGYQARVPPDTGVPPKPPPGNKDDGGQLDEKGNVSVLPRPTAGVSRASTFSGSASVGVGCSFGAGGFSCGPQFNATVQDVNPFTNDSLLSGELNARFTGRERVQGSFSVNGNEFGFGGTSNAADIGSIEQQRHNDIARRVDAALAAGFAASGGSSSTGSSGGGSFFFDPIGSSPTLGGGGFNDFSLLGPIDLGSSYDLSVPFVLPPAYDSCIFACDSSGDGFFTGDDVWLGGDNSFVAWEDDRVYCDEWGCF